MSRFLKLQPNFPSMSMESSAQVQGDKAHLLAEAVTLCSLLLHSGSSDTVPQYLTSGPFVPSSFFAVPNSRSFPVHSVTSPGFSLRLGLRTEVGEPVPFLSSCLGGRKTFPGHSREQGGIAGL